MTAKYITGHGVTLTVPGQSFTGLLTLLGANEQTREAVESTHHGTTKGRSWIQEALINFGEFDLEFHFDVLEGIPDLATAPALITITFPPSPDDPTATPATLTGSGFFVMGSYPECEAGATETAKVAARIRWDNEEQDPQFTAEVPTP